MSTPKGSSSSSSSRRQGGGKGRGSSALKNEFCPPSQREVREWEGMIPPTFSQLAVFSSPITITSFPLRLWATPDEIQHQKMLEEIVLREILHKRLPLPDEVVGAIRAADATAPPSFLSSSSSPAPPRVIAAPTSLPPLALPLSWSSSMAAAATSSLSSSSSSSSTRTTTSPPMTVLGRHAKRRREATPEVSEKSEEEERDREEEDGLAPIIHHSGGGSSSVRPHQHRKRPTNTNAAISSSSLSEQKMDPSSSSHPPSHHHPCTPYYAVVYVSDIKLQPFAAAAPAAAAAVPHVVPPPPAPPAAAPPGPPQGGTRHQHHLMKRGDDATTTTTTASPSYFASHSHWNPNKISLLVHLTITLAQVRAWGMGAGRVVGTGMRATMTTPAARTSTDCPNTDDTTSLHTNLLQVVIPCSYRSSLPLLPSPPLSPPSSHHRTATSCTRTNTMSSRTTPTRDGLEVGDCSGGSAACELTVLAKVSASEVAKDGQAVWVCCDASGIFCMGVRVPRVARGEFLLEEKREDGFTLVEYKEEDEKPRGGKK